MLAVPLQKILSAFCFCRLAFSQQQAVELKLKVRLRLVVQIHGELEEMVNYCWRGAYVIFEDFGLQPAPACPLNSLAGTPHPVSQHAQQGSTVADQAEP